MSELTTFENYVVTLEHNFHLQKLKRQTSEVRPDSKKQKVRPPDAQAALDALAGETFDSNCWPGLALASLALKLFVPDARHRHELAVSLLHECRSMIVNTTNPEAALFKANMMAARFCTELMMYNSLVDGFEIDEDQPDAARPPAEVVSLKQAKDLSP